MNKVATIVGIIFLLLEPSISVTCKNITSPYLSASSRYSLRGNLRVPSPPHANEGDLLILLMSRSDDVLPLELDGWTTGPSCFKEVNTGNHIRECWTAEDCLESTTSSSGIKYCTRFPYNHTGKDLATIVFHKPIAKGRETNDEIFDWDLPGYHPAWATLVVISSANMTDPIRSSANTACDRRAAAVFPSVRGAAGDVLLLSMAHDDPAALVDFQPPLGTRFVQEQHGPDEAGFVYTRRLNSTGKTPKYATRGNGTQWYCKDALLSLVIRMLPSADDSNNNNSSNELLILDGAYDSCHDVDDSTVVTITDLLSGLYDLLSGLWGFVLGIGKAN